MYGEVMGRECVRSGIALGRILYIGHGTRATPSERCIFEDSEEMRSNGSELYCGLGMSTTGPMESSGGRSAALSFMEGRVQGVAKTER